MQPGNNTISRRHFLRGRFRKKENPIRPPWALLEDEFTSTCTQCKKCVLECPEKIIVRGEEGFPVVNFSLGGCTFCQKCVEVCDVNALSINSMEQPPWNLLAEVSTQCISMQGVACRSCADSCEEEAISFQLQVGGKSLPEINSASCTGCGSCIAFCPVNAIKVSNKRTREEVDYGHD